MFCNLSLQLANGIPGHYMQLGDPITSATLDTVIADDKQPESAPKAPWITADVTSSFTVLLAIFFPSVTGEFLLMLLSH